MLKKLYTAIVIVIAAGNFAMGQSGVLKGKALDEINGEGISFANIQLEQNGNAVAKGVADINGDFTIKPITPGIYDVKIASVGYQTYFSKGVVIGGDKTTYVDAKVKSTTTQQDEVVIVEYVVPLIDPDTKSGGTVTREEFLAMPSKNINSVAATTAGVFQQDEGGALNVRGSRSDGTDYYVDGEKVRGSAGLPQGGVEQISVITGGVPAQYGDATGGFINITTRGGMRNEFFGGVELISSQLTDAYDYNFAGFNVGGPVIVKKDSSGNKDAKVGFFISGEVTADKDPNPSAVGIYKVNDEKQKFLEENPLAASETGGGTLLNAELLRASDLEHIKARQNVNSNTARLSGKLDFKVNKNIVFTLGGSVAYNNGRVFALEYALLNPNQNPQNINNTTRIYGRITHKFGKNNSREDQSTSLLQNAYYTLQLGYTKYTETQQDDVHKDNLFDYGYIGKFQTKQAAAYALVIDTNAAPGMDTIYEQVAISDTQVVFTSGDQNPLASNYTSQFYSLVAGEPNTLSDIQQGYGLLNGDRPRSVYSIWYNTGRVNNQYYNINQTQLRATGQFSADIKNHAIQVGFEYEKRNDKQWVVAPIGMWGLMRQLTNKHITQLDTLMTQVTGPILLSSGTLLANPQYDAYAHPYIINSSEQSVFDYNFRNSISAGAGQWLDVDSYTPSAYNLGMFSPDELMNGAASTTFGSMATWFGYTPEGKKLTGKNDFDLAALESFYKDKNQVFTYADKNPSATETSQNDLTDTTFEFTRTIPAFQPTYVSGYIQDKFDIKDMKFNIGLRVDHFDANQPVLRDPFLFYEANTAGEVTTVGSNTVTHPTNIPSSAVVYVDDAKNPNSILGYRDETVWYNAQGVQIADPTIITPSTGVIQPYLKYPNEKFLGTSKVDKVFDMYKAQNTFMPRVAFSFPISKEANFFAHYDVLTQRPPTALRFNPTSYLFIQTVGGVVNNPALKPERTTDYELGFSQVLNERKNAAITLSAFYREMRDMIQQTILFGAYPQNYTTYANIDFGTVKGFTVAYDLRRTNNVQMTASYTLQFADGTGSAATSASGIIGAAGQTNLRTTMPLDFDQRHAIVINTDYRFGEGKDYSGPQAKWAKMIFENLGGNIVFRAGSGLPYTRQKNVTSGNGDNSSAVVFGINQRATLKGKLNGSNLPWQYRADIRIDKNIALIWKKAEGESKGKSSNLNIYVQILNVLNTKNIINLYRFTGSADDDGYLSAPEYQNGIENYLDPQSFRDLYTSKIANPSHYSIPRRTRIGIVLDF